MGKTEKSQGKLRYLLLFLSAVVCALLCSVSALAAGTVTVRYSGRLDYDKANEVYTLVNRERSAQGVGALAQNYALQEAAMVRAREIALYFSHTRPDGTRGLEIIPNKAGGLGENIACGSTTSESVMNLWMNSPGHRANILDSAYRQIGIGCFYQNGTWWWVQLFNGSSAASSCPSGSVTSTADVNVLPQYIDLSVQIQDGSSYGTTDVTEGQSSALMLVQRNTAPEVRGRKLILHAGSAAWSALGNVYRLSGAAGEYQNVIWSSAAENPSVSITFAGTARNVTLPVRISHKTSGTNCEKDLYCDVCGILVERRIGHMSVFPVYVCTQSYTCQKCWKTIPAAGHSPSLAAATCKENNTCLVCGTVLEYKRSHKFSGGTCQKRSCCSVCGASGDFGSHRMSAWKVSRDGSYKTRKCSLCGGGYEKKSIPVRVKALKIKGRTSMLAGKNQTLKVSVAPANASNKKVSWSVSSKKYATISSKGVITAKAAGAGKTVKVTAKARDGSGRKATFSIKIKGPVKKIQLKAAKTLRVGRKTTVKATVSVGKGGSKALTWSSSNKRYATVTSKGTVRALKAGRGKTVTITAKAKDGSGKKASIKIKIK